MKVKELIEELKKYPEDAVVVRADTERPSEVERVWEWYKTDWDNDWLWDKEFYDRMVNEWWKYPKIIWPAVYLY